MLIEYACRHCGKVTVNYTNRSNVVLVVTCERCGKITAHKAEKFDRIESCKKCGTASYKVEYVPGTHV